ncbi:hypothetical protein PLICRDRAFT_108342 [Plicaturopsis crispa FD-325 SS-3]|nr:hypothetical protein PLICRDRAFT_108342 [Plicaturopsis crispa FD-325 SS-3]
MILTQVIFREIMEEAINIDLENAEDLEKVEDIDGGLDAMMKECLDDFPDEEKSEIADYAASIAKASITDATRTGHVRIIKAYITWHMSHNKQWDPRAVTKQTPFDIRHFITQKCGPKSDGYEGRKFSTAVSTRAALTMWYRSVRPNESVSEWRLDPKTDVHGLPTRSRSVSEFIMGLQKTKAKSGEVSQSARALDLQDMYRLHDHCLFKVGATAAERRWGIVRYAAYLLAWLMLLRIEEAIHLKFESIDIIPGTSPEYDVRLETRKSAQTGVLHAWRLHTNDQDPRVCPVRALVRIATLYGDKITPSGPLFLRVNKHGAVLQDMSVVCNLTALQTRKHCS